MSESVKKENLWRKYFFSDNVEWVSKYLCKMTSDVKANLNNNRSGGSILKEVPSRIEIHCNKGMYFSFEFDWYSIHLDIVY